MIKTFIYEIERQIVSTNQLYIITKFEPFRKRIQKFEAKKKEILITFEDLSVFRIGIIFFLNYLTFSQIADTIQDMSFEIFYTNLAPLFPLR